MAFVRKKIPKLSRKNSANARKFINDHIVPELNDGYLHVGGLVEQIPTGGKRVRTPLGDTFAPQFAPTLYFVDTDARLAIDPGYVFGPYSDAAQTLYQPQVQQFPFAPKIGADLLTADPAPYLNIGTGEPTFVWLKITWLEFTTPITNDDSTGILIDAGGNLDDPVSGQVSGYNHLYLDTRTYAIDLANPPVFIANDTGDPPTETTTVTHILSGFYVLDGDNEVTENAWFLEGPIWAERNNYVMTNNTGAGSSVPEPPTITTASNSDVPVWTGG